MTEEMPTIKFLEDKIITTKDGVVEVWSRWNGDESKFIVYQGIRYKLSRTKEASQ